MNAQLPHIEESNQRKSIILQLKSQSLLGRVNHLHNVYGTGLKGFASEVTWLIAVIYHCELTHSVKGYILSHGLWHLLGIPRFNDNPCSNQTIWMEDIREQSINDQSWSPYPPDSECFHIHHNKQHVYQDHRGEARQRSCPFKNCTSLSDAFSRRVTLTGH